MVAMVQSVSVRERVQDLWWDALALVWPAECMGCGRADRELCRECAAQVRACEPEVTPVWGVPCVAGGPYAGIVRRLLGALKHEDLMWPAGVLGERMAEVLHTALDLDTRSDPEPPLIVSVPSRRARVRSRGYQHVDLMVARALRTLHRQQAPHAGLALRVGQAPRAGIPLAALAATRGRTGQVGLSAIEREHNACRLRVRRHARAILQGREVIVADDIVTTGATVRAAIGALETAGARVIAVAALCRVTRNDTREDFEVESENQNPVKFEAGVMVRHSGAPV